MSAEFKQRIKQKLRLMHKILSYVFGYKYPHPVEKAFNKLTCYHYYFFTWLFLVKIPLFWRVLGLIFLTPPLDYACVTADNTTLNSCPCDSVIWDSRVFTKTLHTKFNLVCEREWFATFMQSILYVGSLIGSFIFGFLSDKFGRLSMFMMTCLILCVSGLANSFMPNIYGYIIIRCIEGIGLGGSIVTSFVLLVEFCGTKNRELMVALYHIPINVAHVTLAGVSYLVRDCDYFQLTMTVPLFVFLLMQVLTTESPKWLLDKNRIDDAVKVMDKIGKCNKTQYPNMRYEMQAYQSSKSGSGEHRMSFMTIFKYGPLTRNFLCMAANYFGCGAGYYGVSQYIGKMSGKIHQNVAISGAILIPGTLMATVLLQVLGRRPFLMSTNILSGICILSCVLLPDKYNLARVLIACLCNCFFFMSFITVFLYGVELFPTSIRNAVLGVLCVLSRFGQIIAPLINRASQFAAGITFGVIAILAGILCLPLPETKGVELPTTMEDIRKKESTSGSSSQGKKATTSGSFFASSSPTPKKKDTASGSFFGSTSPKKKDTASGSFFGSSKSKNEPGYLGSLFGSSSQPAKK